MLCNFEDELFDVSFASLLAIGPIGPITLTFCVSLSAIYHLISAWSFRHPLLSGTTPKGVFFFFLSEAYHPFVGGKQLK